jgi:predicted nucleic acid-binding protein
MIENFPGIQQFSLDLSMAKRAAEIAVEHRLRGADAVYVAVADAVDAALITWYQEMLKRCPAAVETMTLKEWCGTR